MRVKITSCYSESYWYKDLIGCEFDILDKELSGEVKVAGLEGGYGWIGYKDYVAIDQEGIDYTEEHTPIDQDIIDCTEEYTPITFNSKKEFENAVMAVIADRLKIVCV